ncbi:MAG: class I SAM-dependent methyltransferase [Bryobacterales bacterium]|nr:class I SAM-dependent methyltransferase [Bryobacterales bacterium]
MEPNVAEQMRADWNARAKEDAFYYVAFGRRNQTDDEFLATAAEQVHGLELELLRLPAARPRQRRALEIGCGPGRLMWPMSRHFGEIHGVDISEEMVARARQTLAWAPHAHPHHAPNSNLEAFADDSFDFVYSYAVFQHIPSREVVFGYLEEAWRVLKPGGIARCQLNGLPKTAKQYDTWSGVRISAEELRQFAAKRGFLLLALEGVDTQYMWVTLRKPPAAAAIGDAAGEPSIRRVTSAYSSEPAVPNRGRFAAISVWVTGLPVDADLNRLDLWVGSRPAFLTFLGHPENDFLQQLNALLPEALSTGLQPVELRYDGKRVCEKAWVRLRPPGPPVPRVLSVTDGVDLLAGDHIVNRVVKATVEEVESITQIGVDVNGTPAEEVDVFCTDPRLPRHEINFRIPSSVSKGAATLEFRVGERRLGVTQVVIDT